MIDWAEIGKTEKAARAGLAVAMAIRLMECARREDVIGAAISGLSAVAVLGLSAEDIRMVLAALERSGGDADA
ncbi:MAG: hypothetical protein ACE5IP_09870 [Terriglobia bacterium]